MTALLAPKAARPVLLRHWRDAVWRDQDYWTGLLVILSALLAVRLMVLVFGETDLFFDEAQYWTWSRVLAFDYFSKPPLIAWIIRSATQICGDSGWCVRALSPILYPVTSSFVFLAARAVWRSHRVLVRGGACHFAGGVFLLAADLDRRSSSPVLDRRPLMDGSG